ncbi:MAG: SCP2 sterol-binding domain-containing protein [Promethearchaeota archaeon]
MVKFGTPEYAELLIDAINSNEAYAKAADWWTGDFVFQVEPHGSLDHQIRIWVGLHHGKCTGSKILDEDEQYTLLNKGDEPAGKPYEVEFVYSAKLDVWEKILKKEMDPIRALLSGQAKVQGDMPKILRATDAAKELVASAASLDTEFYD